MVHRESSRLQAARCAVPDPRYARGQRSPWPVLLTLIAAAVASGQCNLRAIGQWVTEHAAELNAALAPPRGHLPSPSPRRRAVQAVEVVALEARLAACVASVPPPPAADRCTRWEGQAMDGTAVCGANRHDAGGHLVRRVRHVDAGVLGQVAVADTSNEITTAPRLLAEQILAQYGHYLMVVTATQPTVGAAMDRLFAGPRWCRGRRMRPRR